MPKEWAPGSDRDDVSWTETRIVLDMLEKDLPFHSVDGYASVLPTGKQYTNHQLGKVLSMFEMFGSEIHSIY